MRARRMQARRGHRSDSYSDLICSSAVSRPRGMMLSSFARIYLIGLLMLTKFCLSIYTVQPVSLNTTLNSTVTFTCKANRSTAYLIYFYVGFISANEDSIVKRGFTQESQYTVNETLQRTLSVWAQETNNNTNISCGTAPGDVRSTIAVLKIQGLLASVSDLTVTFINGSSVLLSWTTPYTLDNVPITRYYIDDGSMNYITNGTTSFVVSSIDPDPCTLANVSVSARNEAGIGQPAYISFYYKRVPLITPTVLVMLLWNKTMINFSMKVEKLCIGEYPNNITFHVFRTDSTVVYSNSISPEINEQMMVMTGHSPLVLPDISTVFIINVSLSNEGGEFNNVLSFGFANGPVTNIRSVIYNCTNMTISWDSPNGTNYMDYYRLEIYDNSNDQLVHSAMVHGTSYLFEVDRLIYKFIITGVNEIGEGMSETSIISLQKIPKSPQAVCTILNRTNDYVYYLVDILSTMDCILEAPDNIIIHVLCKEIGTVFSRIYQAEHSNVTEFVFSVPQYQKECNLTILLSNNAGRSDPFIIRLDTTSPATANFIQSPTIISTSTNSTTSIVITVVMVSVCTVIMLLIVCFSVLVIIIIYMKRRSKTANIVSVPNPAYDDIDKFKTNISINPAYGEVKTDTRQNVIYDEIIL
ncbi:PREDICTED: uncharacterized protein LOC109583141 isoform X2 [Amphimedon queenslandica]|uniref:Fibronectin type-III domain-containing protein n=1 Tax=Amphimedon queenslandica TaxID=400682 RepID=A0AAN0JAZ9_AMPQE|nr:PREDICTED: uncharacterized protein LOC109583141 isoform X2 [Amphimedon queenslandica]|eukprot:XP_019853911.1 PREDICTED: uncharacterized protein LOC109583141 isoform X2 [Amphimedon queenslandica]